MLRKPAPKDSADLGLESVEHPMMNILLRTAVEELDGVNELLEIQARRNGGRPYIVLPRNPDTIH